MPEPLNSLVIGVLELLLALALMHRALPAMMALAHQAHPLPGIGAMRTVAAMARAPVGRRARMAAITAFTWRTLTARVGIFKIWALAMALGALGIGRALAPVYHGRDAELLSLGHWCLIAYAALRLLTITRAHGAHWWNIS